MSTDAAITMINELVNVDHRDVTPLYQLAETLIQLMLEIKFMTHCTDVDVLYQELIEQVRVFENRANEHCYSSGVINSAKYCLCAAIDERVLVHDWGNTSQWSQQSLVNYFYQQTWGGDKFYHIVEDEIKNELTHADFIVLIYFLLSLGFEGRLHGENNRYLRERIRCQLLKKIQPHYAHIQFPADVCKSTILPHAQDKRRLGIIRFAAASMIYLVILSSILNVSAHFNTAPLIKKLTRIAISSPIVALNKLRKSSGNNSVWWRKGDD